MPGRRLAFVAAALLTARALARMPLPPVVCVAYTFTACGAPVVTAVRNGVNVCVWTFAEVTAGGDGSPVITTVGLDLDCVATTYSTLATEGLPAVHLVSIGGWGHAHPAVTSNPAGVYAAWKAWNEATVPRGGFPGFDGLDWNVEGADALSSPDNVFTAALLDTMGAPRARRGSGFSVGY